MTLDEAIQHCEKVAEKLDKMCKITVTTKATEELANCASEHQQLAEWLKELKVYKEKETCKTCGHYTAYQHGADITTMDDECGGCCSWNSRWIPNTCGDAISGQEVLNGIDTYINKAQSTGTQDDFYSFAELVVKDLPSVTPQHRTLSSSEKPNKWILVSERLPDDRKPCLVTFKSEHIEPLPAIMCYAQDLYKVDEYDFYTEKGKAGWYDYDSEYGYYSRDDVIAWMPLPEPYKSESEVEG